MIENKWTANKKQQNFLKYLYIEEMRNKWPVYISNTKNWIKIL